MKSIPAERAPVRTTRWLSAAVLLVLAAGLLAPAGTARAADTVRWQPAAIWGADVRSLAVHPYEPDTVVAGTSSGQIYLSTDGGEEWREAGIYLPFPGWVVASLVFEPGAPAEGEPTRLWAGLRGVWGDGMVSASDDLGTSWDHREGDFPDLPVYALALSPGIVYAGTLDGVWATTDGGTRWSKVTRDIDGMGKVTSLWVPDGEPGTVVAGTWRRAYKSDDFGATWRGVFEGMFIDSEVFALIPTAKPGELWAPTCNWVYQSLDGGESWRRFVEGMDERRATAFSALPWGRLLTGTVAGLYVSDDQGRHWKRTSGDELSIHTIAHHPGRNRIFLGTEGSGVWVSSDGGDTVRPSSVGMTNLRVADVAATPRELFVAVNHAGPGSGVYVSRDGGRSFPGRPTELPTVLDLAAEPLPGSASPDGARIWAGTERGLYERRAGGWVRVEAFGQKRVEQVLTGGGRMVVRTHDEVWERTSFDPADPLKDVFAKTAYSHGSPRSAALRGGELWVTDSAGLYRVAEGSNHTVDAPYSRGRVSALGGRLVYTGEKGTWMRGASGDSDGAWEALGSEPSRVLPTSDTEHPAVLFEGGSGGDRVRLLDARGEAVREVALPIPPRFVDAVLVHDGRLFLATSGFGLLSTELSVGEPSAEAP
jgi:photosystem II stability/assembly factor-like uncharacterized protein